MFFTLRRQLSDNEYIEARHFGTRKGDLYQKFEKVELITLFE